MKQELLAVLSAYIENQVRLIRKIWDEIDSIQPENREKTSHLGYLLHNLYCALEDLFHDVAKTFENRIEDPERFHRELLQRMSLNIPGIRPRVLSEKSLQTLNELRAFRHVFRHGYGFELDPQRLLFLKKQIKRGRRQVYKDLDTFARFILDRLDEPGNG